MNNEYSSIFNQWTSLKSGNDKIGVPLESIVAGCAIRAVCFMNDFLWDLHELFVGGSFIEFFFQASFIELFKAFHTWTVSHHDDAFHDLFFVLSDEFETEKEQQFKVFENVRLSSFHQFHVIGSELKWRLLKPHISGRRGQDEGEINMNDVAISVYENIIVVPVLDWKQVLDKTVASQTLNEVGNSSFPVQTEDLFVDILQRLFTRFFLKITDSSSVIYKLNQAAVVIEGNHIVGPDPEF